MTIASLHRQFTSLPSEILTELMAHLDQLSLIRCLLVCRLLNKIIRQTSELTYMIELYRDGMVDTGFTKLSHLERLELLRGRRRAWAHLDWKTASTVQLNGLCHAYELVGGIFAHGDSLGDEFVTTMLQSSTRPGHQICRKNIQMHPRDFAIDPGQDLIIYIEAHGHPMSFEDARVFRLYVQSIATQEAHPRARSPILEVVVPPNSAYGTFVRGITLQLADDIVAVMLYTGHQQLVLFNWKDGISITDSSQHGRYLDRDIEFAFVSPRAYILTTSQGEGCIQIYSFESVEGFDPIHVASLSLPGLHAGDRFQSISPHTGPFETPSLNAPFMTISTSRIYVITLSVLYRTRLAVEPQSEIFYLFVKCSTFLSYLTAFHSSISSGAMTVPWVSWGPSQTRLLPGLPSYSSWLRYVHGQRVVMPQKRETSEAPVVRVLDFNIHPSLEDEHDAKAPYICATPTAIRHGFSDIVTTTLPYSSAACTLSKHSDEYSAFMIDEERIVGIKAIGDFDEEIKELHVFTF